MVGTSVDDEGKRGRTAALTFGVLVLLAVGGWYVSRGGSAEPPDVPGPAGAPTLPRPANRPNILLITIDTLRADHMSVYGYVRETTPRIEAFAAEGTVFDEAYAPMPSTFPSHATLFTGLLPAEHGAVKNGLSLPEGFVTLAEVVREQGYTTGAIVSSFPVDSRFGLAQGFSHYDDAFVVGEGETGSGIRNWEGHPVDKGFDRDAVATTDRAARWLASHAGAEEPFFLWVHYFDPHHPYLPRREYRQFHSEESDDPVAATIDAYDGEILETDASVGVLLERLSELGAADDTLCVLTADHGEGMEDHGWTGHGIHVYEEAVRIPLVMRWPGRIEAGARREGLVQLADVMPTILDYLELPTPEGQSSTGMSLAPIAGGRELSPERAILLQRRAFDTPVLRGHDVRGLLRGVRVGDWKYIESPVQELRELYDLRHDPHERVNELAAQPERSEAMSALLRREFEALRPPPQDAREVSESDAERLRALGYVQ